jgi:glycosyltransferase involved in cell wall biosynthesis
VTTASVVVPAYNEADRLEQCLSSLAGQDAEVVVVAGGDDGTPELAASHDAVDVVVRDENRGPGAARNRGVEAASGDVVLFTDADTVVPEDWVVTHRRHYEDDDVVGVGGPAAPLEGGLRNRVLFTLLSDWWYRVSWPVGFVQLPTFNCSYRTATFREHGGFDESIPMMEDTELSLRLRDAGTLPYDPETRVETSARREQDEGYLSLFATYVSAYVTYFLLGREPDEEGFFED